MRLGILTFHWATNYGAILQAYALQTYLQKMGHVVYIINYRPGRYKKFILKCFYTKRFWLIPDNVIDYIKEKRLEVFRKKYFNETILYESLEELEKNPPKFDAYICGSDQIWNPSFTTNGEGGPTPVYFLSFGDKKVKRIAYAISFGCENYPGTAGKIAKEYMPGLDAISVRENSGISILSKLGINDAQVLPDPTLLLESNDYSFDKVSDVSPKKRAFIYILRKENKIVRDIVGHIENEYSIERPNKAFNIYSVEDWANSIKNASLVVTNSYHGMLFSIINHVPFTVILSEGKAACMNDRFISLLNYLGLQKRALSKFDSKRFNSILDDNIDWGLIDTHVEVLKDRTRIFFKETLHGLNPSDYGKNIITAN